MRRQQYKSVIGRQGLSLPFYYIKIIRKWMTKGAAMYMAGVWDWMEARVYDVVWGIYTKLIV